MGWFEDFFDDTLDVVADAVVGVSSAAIDTAVKARQAGVVFPPGEAVADFDQCFLFVYYQYQGLPVHFGYYYLQVEQQKDLAEAWLACKKAGDTLNEQNCVHR